MLRDSVFKSKCEVNGVRVTINLQVIGCRRIIKIIDLACADLAAFSVSSKVKTVILPGSTVAVMSSEPFWPSGLLACDIYLFKRLAQNVKVCFLFCFNNHYPDPG